MSNSSKAAIAFLVGAAIGAGIGILFAPDEGSKTRKKLKDGFDAKKDELKKRIEDLTSILDMKLEDPENSIQSALEDVAQHSEGKSSEIIDSLEKKLADLRAAAAKMND